MKQRIFASLLLALVACVGASSTPTSYPPYPPYPPYPAYADYPDYPAYPGASSSSSRPRPPRKVGGPGLGTQYSPPLFATGTSGTYTVPAGDYVYGIITHTSAGGTLVITANTATISDAGASPTITLPIGSSLNLGPPYLPASPYSIADGSTLAFTGTDSYFVWLVHYVYP